MISEMISEMITMLGVQRVGAQPGRRWAGWGLRQRVQAPRLLHEREGSAA